MKYEWIDEYLLKKPGVTKDFQEEWNWIRYHIGGKMFAAICRDDDDKPYYITLKTDPLEGEFLRKEYEDIIPGYYMNKVHWNSVKAGKIPKKNTEPNDDKGPGENTNNPKDPNHSTKDRSDNSTSGSYKDYTDNQKNLQETNKSQKTGSDSNAPSTPAPKPNTNVDNNGDKGNGGAPINTPTPKREAETVKNDPPADHMDEPS